MYTPQGRAATPWVGLMSPRSEVARGIKGKGKAVAFTERPPLPPPPVGSLGGSGEGELEAENMDDWRRFREAGFLDEAAMERRDRQALMEKAARLEKELSDYQYNMGLLLIEKKEWNSRHEGLKQALAEAQEILKREQSANLIALSAVEERGENLTTLLFVEKQSVADLEKVLRDLQKEHLQIKQTSETKLADAEALASGIKEKAVEVEEKLHAADSKLAEVDRKNSELDMKLQELEARENVLEREHLSLNTEKEAHGATFYRQREDLHEWEKKLQKREENLFAMHRTLNQKEQKSNEQENFLKQKEKVLEKTEKKIDLQFSKLKEREDDVNNCLSSLTVKEKNVDSAGSLIALKEKELIALEKKLSDRERVEFHELLNEHKTTLDSRVLELEEELEEKRKNIDNELRSKAVTVEMQEVEIRHREDKLERRELALDRKLERVKEKEKELEAKLKILKESDKSMRVEQKKLEVEKQQLATDRENLQLLRTDYEKMRAEIALQERQMGEQREKLKITNDDRLEQLRLQAELKQELEKCRRQEECLLRESKDLKQEREKFEKEWEVLEEKRAQITKQLKEIVEEREKLENLQCIEGKSLREKKASIEKYIQSELEAVRLEKESFEHRMKQEQIVLSERAQKDHDQMIQNFESQRQQFEADLLSRQEEMERSLRAKERDFKELKDRELSYLNNLREVAQREFEVMQSERGTISKEKQEVAENKEKIEGQQFELQKDIKELEMLSKKLRHQRQQVVREKHHFLAFVEKHKSCKNCGESTREFVLSDLQPPELGAAETSPLSRLADELSRDNQVAVDGDTVTINASPGEVETGYSDSRGRMSWLQKCTSKIFSRSPVKKMEPFSNPKFSEEFPLSPSQAEKEKAKGLDSLVNKVEISTRAVNRDQPQISLSAADGSVDTSLLQSAGDTIDGGCSVSVDDHSFIDSKLQETPGDSGLSTMKTNRLKKPARRRKGGPSRTRSVKAVVEDAKLFLADSSNTASVQPNASDNLQGVVHNNEAPREISKKRQRVATESEQDGGDSEGHSESVTAGGRWKRQQKATSAMPTPGQTRYNLRRQKIDGIATATRAPSNLMEKKVGRGNGGSQVETTQVHQTASLSSSVSGKVRVTTPEDTELPHNMVRAKVTKPAGDIEQSEEVNGTPEHEHEDENGSTIYEENEDEYDEEDESEHPGEVSVGKKIWTFFTT